MGKRQDIRIAIKNKLQSVSSIAFVYSFHTADLEGYPAATFDLSEIENEFLTNKENLRTFSIKIVLYQEITEKGLDAAEIILNNVADAVVSAIESDLTLGGTVDWCEPLVGPKGTFETSQGLTLFEELTLRCKATVLV